MRRNIPERRRTPGVVFTARHLYVLCQDFDGVRECAKRCMQRLAPISGSTDRGKGHADLSLLPSVSFLLLVLSDGNTMHHLGKMLVCAAVWRKMLGSLMRVIGMDRLAYLALKLVETVTHRLKHSP